MLGEESAASPGGASTDQHPDNNAEEERNSAVVASYPETEDDATALRGLDQALRNWTNAHNTSARKKAQGSYTSLFKAAEKKGLVKKGSPPGFEDWRKEFAGCSEELRAVLERELQHQEASSSTSDAKRPKPKPTTSKGKAQASKRQKLQNLSDEMVLDSEEEAGEASNTNNA